MKPRGQLLLLQASTVVTRQPKYPRSEKGVRILGKYTIVGIRAHRYRGEEDAASTSWRPRSSSRSSSGALWCSKASAGCPLQVLQVSLHGLPGSSGSRAGRQDHHATVGVQRGTSMYVHLYDDSVRARTRSDVYTPHISRYAQISIQIIWMVTHGTDRGL